MSLEMPPHTMGGSQRLFVRRIETMEFNIFIITQIVHAIVTFKLIIFSISGAYIVHLSTPTRVLYHLF